MMTEFATRVLVGLVRLYQIVASPILHLAGPSCRFHPTCSAYAIEALQKYGPLDGSLRALKRLSRCHPWHPGGIDPP